jgi:hypothetical protein
MGVDAPWSKEPVMRVVVAGATGAIGKKQTQVPWLAAGEVGAGEVGAVLMGELRGASNATARCELGWQPAQPSWRQGLAT